jgi:hypothetical protein
MTLFEIPVRDLSAAMDRHARVRTVETPHRFGALEGYGGPQCSVAVHVDGDRETTEWHADEWELA